MNCIRNMWYQVNGSDQDDGQTTYSLIGICNSGSDIHERIQKAVCAMKDNGMDCEYVDVETYVKDNGLKDIDIVSKQGMETKLYHKKYNMSFLCDGIIKYHGKYYFSYSTGDSHLLCYAVGDNPYGPFTYKGVILTPVVGWTTHHAILQYEGKWYLFHHDSVPSGGKSWLRSLKVCELEYDAQGHIRTIEGTDK